MKKILIAEDDLFLNRLLKVKLEKIGFAVTAATDGGEIVNLVKKISPDLLILDIMLPKKDGFQILREIRADNKTNNCRVLVLTKLRMKEDVDLLNKFNVEIATSKSTASDIELLEIVKRILK